ncbi:ATPase component BioM of energizing module of biotin ECF transporter [invertebrate metagenome]|uniref:ATPase component BioM of energizing module of biotin ECF transporter n=1 Tax=invertebrate metagenome TaxID=1711999 RepID=A0A484H7H9_9ZZZZ
MPHGPLAAYRHHLTTGVIQPDPAQELAAEKLESLHRALAGYRPSADLTGWKTRFGLVRRTAPPQGLYLFGDVGRGKSMLMDMFFRTSTVNAKRRVHFHAFLRDVHTALHAWRKSSHREPDPLPTLARNIARQVWLLCLDELEIKDIADAMIVGRLFEGLLAHGVVVVTTSNRAPDELYKDGLQRAKFLPFIALIKEKLDVLELSGERDFRIGRMRGLRVYHVPPGPEADAGLAECFRRFANGQTPAEEQLVVYGRILRVPHAAGRIARFSFSELCEAPLGAADYLQLATHYDVILVADIPRLLPERLNAARRFITLIDALYEHRVLLVCSAAALPHELYLMNEGTFEFQRTASRLVEMQADDYIRRPHLT